MRVSKLIVENFGPHSFVEFNPGTSNVVGIIGPNGSGKSNILWALEWAITGKLSDNKETYIKGYMPGLKLPAASVFAEIVKNGKTFTIKRRMTASSGSVELKWDGKTYDKSKEVDAKIGEILGAGRSSIMNSVFVGQGELDRLYFGLLSERMALFSKILNLGNIEPMARRVDTYVKRLAASVVDRRPQLESEKVRRDEANTKREEMEMLLLQTPECGEQLKQARAYSAANLVLLRETNRYRTCETALANSKKVLTDAMSERGITPDKLANITTRLTDLNSKVIPTLLNAKNLSSDVISLRDARDAKVTERNSLTPRIAAAEERMTAEKAKLNSYPIVDVTALKNLHREADEGKAIKLPDLEAALRGNKSLLSAVHIPSRALKKAKVESVQGEISRLNQDIQLYTVALATHAATCPCCGSASFDRDAMAKALEEKRLVQLPELQKALTAASTALSNVDDTIRQVESKITTGEGDVTRAAARLKAIAEKIPDYLSRDFVTEVVEAERIKAERDAVSTAVNVGEGQLRTLRERASSLDTEIITANGKLAGAEGRALAIGIVWGPDKETELAAAQKEAEDLSSKSGIINELHNSVSVAEGSLRLATLAVTEATEEFNKVAITGVPVDAIAQRIVDLEIQDATNQEARGRLKQAEETHSTLVLSVKSLEKEVEENDRRLSALDDLKELHRALTANGVPGLYSQYVFNRLIELASTILPTLGADFTIEASNEEALMIRFRSLNDPNAPTLSQNKLSGGQRVKTSFALLLAVQRIVLPDLGFLALDEPSLHLDQDGRTDLRDSIQGVAGFLLGSDNQFWIIDHAQELQTAFQACHVIRGQQKS